MKNLVKILVDMIEFVLLGMRYHDDVRLMCVYLCMSSCVRHWMCGSVCACCGPTHLTQWCWAIGASICLLEVEKLVE